MMGFGEDTTGDNLEWLLKHASSFSVTGNDQRGGYRSVAEEFATLPECYDDMPEDVKAECIKRDALVTVHVYPATQVGSYAWSHYDVREAIAQAYDFLSAHPEFMKVRP